MKRVVSAATETSDIFKDAITDLEDNFDYLVSGFEAMARMNGKEGEKRAISLMSSFSDQMAAVISEVAQNM